MALRLRLRGGEVVPAALNSTIDQQPFFEAGLLVTAPNGTYGGIRQSKRVRAFDDRIEIDNVRIYYPYLTDLRVYSNVLHLAYMASDGKQVEQFFKYNTFRAKNGAAELAKMAAQVAEARKKYATPSVWKTQALEQQQAVKSELVGDRNAAVYSALVAFPAVCPGCLKPAEAIGRLQLSAGLDEKGSWLVPACHEHALEVPQYVKIANWRAASSRLEFAFQRKEYAKYFVSLNSGKPDETVLRQLQSAPLLFDIRNGKRFVVYQYAVSVLVISMMRPSAIEMIEARGSRFVRGLKYSLISFVAGWWGIPHGPIFTIASIVRNCRGGLDVTPAVSQVLRGTAMSGGGF